MKFGTKYKHHPTPKVIKFWFKLCKRICVVFGASSIVMENKWAALGCAILLGVLEETQEYFGYDTPPSDKP